MINNMYTKEYVQSMIACVVSVEYGPGITSCMPYLCCKAKNIKRYASFIF